MRWTKSRSAPREFTAWCRENAPVTEHAWEDLTAEAKDALRARLSEDQTGLCAYCLVRLGPVTKIEHVVPQAPDTRFDWTNLALCCPGETDGAPHCDTAKADQGLDRVHPYHHPVQAHVLLKSDGRLASTHEAARHDVEEVLRLNHPGLRRRREAALRALLSDADPRFGATRHIPSGPLARTLTELRSRQGVDYQPLLEQWLERQVSKR